MLITQFGS